MEYKDFKPVWMVQELPYKLINLQHDTEIVEGFIQKSFSSASKTNQKIEISAVASLDMILSRKQITQVQIRLRGCSVWSAPLLLANPGFLASRPII